MNLDLNNIERYSIDELTQLKILAEEYIRGHGMTKCKWLYRNKSRKYFDSITTNNKGWMNTIKKDCGGDARSPINGCLKGLFFSASVEPGSNDSSPREKSAFGKTRINIDIGELADRKNLYFTDFFCMGTVHTKKGKYHYVTLVITDHNSIADRFCSQFLLKLDWASNQFLCRKFSQYDVTVKEELLVEVFYTENINITQLIARGKARMDEVETFGQGHSTTGGKPKNPICEICNLNNLYSSSYSRRATISDVNNLNQQYKDAILKIMNSKQQNNRNKKMLKRDDSNSSLKINVTKRRSESFNSGVYSTPRLIENTWNFENSSIDRENKIMAEPTPRAPSTYNKLQSVPINGSSILASNPAYRTYNWQEFSSYKSMQVNRASIPTSSYSAHQAYNKQESSSVKSMPINAAIAKSNPANQTYKKQESKCTIL